MTHPILDEYERETRVSPATADRLAAASVRRHVAPPRRARLLTLPAVGLVVGLAAALLVYERPPPAVPSQPAAPAASPPEPEILASTGVSAARTLASGVTLAWEGVGQLSGEDAVAWEAGTLHVEVPPNRGIRFTVETREATIRVVGTGFSVGRGALGTDIEVTHGRVDVACEDEPAVLLGPGESRSCLPVSAAGLLARARALDAGGAPTADIVAAIDRGLGRAEEGEASIVSELRYLRADVAWRGGDLAGARVDVERWLAETPTEGRRVDALRLAVEIALSSEGCAAALEPLRALATSGGSAEDLALLRDCGGRAPGAPGSRSTPSDRLEDGADGDRSGAPRPPGE